MPCAAATRANCKRTGCPAAPPAYAPGSGAMPPQLPASSDAMLGSLPGQRVISLMG